MYEECELGQSSIRLFAKIANREKSADTDGKKITLRDHRGRRRRGFAAFLIETLLSNRPLDCAGEGEKGARPRAGKPQASSALRPAVVDPKTPHPGPAGVGELARPSATTPDRRHAQRAVS